MNKKYGLMGKFQFPLNIISFFTIILLFILISYEIFTNLYEFIFKIILLKGNLFNSFDFRFPTLNEIIINANIRLLFPLFISFLLSFYILKKAHKSMNEKLIFNPALFIYFTVYPLIRTAHWITAFYKEIIKTKRKW
jgi:hypothetical protein